MGNRSHELGAITGNAIYSVPRLCLLLNYRFLFLSFVAHNVC